MTAQPLDDSKRGLTPIQWLICTIAAIGFAFDIYVILVAPLVIPPALINAGLRPGTPPFASWASWMFYAPAMCGGVFGLLGGYLTDRLGRRRVLTGSILLYAVSGLLSGFSTSLWMLLVFRCLTFVGVCVEFVAAVAWLAELFPDPKRREKVLGFTQAFSSFGGILAATANGIAVAHHDSLPAIAKLSWLQYGPLMTFDPHAAWRYTLISGVIPAIPLIVIRPFLPESPAWRQKRDSGTLRRPSIAALFSPALLRTTVVTTLMFACAYGAAFGAIQQIPQIVGGTPEVQAQIGQAIAEAKAHPTAPVTKPVTQPNSMLTAPGALGALTSTRPTTAPAVKGVAPAGSPDPMGPVKALVVQRNAASVSKVQELGGLVGRFVLAMLAVVIVSRQKLIRVFQVPGLIVMPIVFAFCAIKSLNLLYVGIFLAGFFTVAQLSFWGNYLPRVYPVHLRGTGESFAANVGGRMLGTLCFGLTQTLAVAFAKPNPSPADASHTLAYTAACVGCAVYLIGLCLSFALPEPPERDLEH